MIIKLPMGVTMDTSNVPNNFGVIIRDSFRKFTDGTKEEYRYEDKLRFIDCCVAYMSRSKDADEAVQDIILSETKRRMSEDGEFPNKSDFESLEFMSICYEIGQKMQNYVQMNMGVISMIMRLR